MDDKQINLYIENYRDDYILFTEYEYQNSPEDVKQLLRERDWIVKAEEYYNITPAYEEFKYHIKNLDDYVRFSSSAFRILDVLQGNDDGFLGNYIDEYGYDNFKLKINDILNNKIYENALINLIILFEAYLNEALGWIYKIDKLAQEKLKVNLTYGEILSNWDNLIDIILGGEMEDFRNFNSRKEAFRKNKINVFREDDENYKLILESIERRNILVHNKGKVNKAYNKRLKVDLPLNTKLSIDEIYYYKINEAINKTIEEIDSKIIKRYT